MTNDKQTGPETMKWPDAPKAIYLQVCPEDDGECNTPFHDHTEVTWCQDRINDGDIEYTRSEEVAKLRAALGACVEALNESVDLVRHDYESDWRHGLPTRKAQLDGKKDLLDAHIAAITQAKELL